MCNPQSKSKTKAKVKQKQKQSKNLLQWINTEYNMDKKYK